MRKVILERNFLNFPFLDDEVEEKKDSEKAGSPEAAA